MRLFLIAVVLAWSFFLPPAFADEKKPQFIPLWPEGAPGAKGKDDKDTPAVHVSLAPADKANGAAVVICPGGGYGALAMDHEGHQIARWLNDHGIAGIILRYRLGPKYNHPTQLHDAQHAVRFTRHNAKEWRIDPARVGIIGFSAGGHLASSVGTHFDGGKKDAKDPVETQSCRPDFMILLYPVITLQGPYHHAGSRNNLLGKKPDQNLVDHLCNEKHVSPDTPPTFLVHTHQDKGVRPENSVFFYLALSQHSVPAELHLYEEGAHGLGLGQNHKHLPFASWPERCLGWLERRGVLKSQKK
ncbi:MAG: alpha/beta hydrolase [Gemmataceae bacterium]|nr:alpha/beta hydrolase [Gemmataceae bacterium]